jgi:hypothetical protein
MEYEANFKICISHVESEFKNGLGDESGAHMGGGGGAVNK